MNRSRLQTRTRPLQHQRGVVLFIALIGLVVMTLGGLALFRNVDSVTAISGNVGYRQKGVGVSSSAVETARAYLLANGASKGHLDSHHASDGYYASQSAYVTNDDMSLFDWANGKKMADQSGYQLWYAIHRLCANTGDANQVETACIVPDSTSAAPESGRSVNYGDFNLYGQGAQRPYYRITVRALGPRNAESMIQVLTY